MSQKKRILLLVMIHLAIALAMWDGYRLGLRRGRAEPRPRTAIIVEPAPAPTLPDVPAEPPERTDVNWRGN